MSKQKVLNLTPKFNPYGISPEDCLSWSVDKFPGGELHFKLLSELERDTDVMIISRITSWEDMGLLLSAYDALLRTGMVDKMRCFVPYFPGARQDLVEEGSGEALSVKVYADLFNDVLEHVDEVSIFDAHSNVTPAVLEACCNHNNHAFIRHVLGDILTYHEQEENTLIHIVSPDAGAEKKIDKLLPEVEGIGYHLSPVYCSKQRDRDSGKLSGFKVHGGDLEGQPCLIVDDICDGGGTFLGIAEKLKEKNAGKLYLAVSHGIFSKGFHQGLGTTFENIYCTDSFDVDDPRFVTVIPFEEFL